jgi:hypothetical protein
MRRRALWQHREPPMNLKNLSLAVSLLSAASLAHAGQPAATLACVANGANISINLSYFDVGASASTGDPREWAGARAPVLSLTINAALASFQTLYQNAAAGTVMPTCTLSTLASNGDTVQFVMKSVQVKSVAAQASSANVAAPAASFVNAVLGYASVTVIDIGSGADDGGASPTGGYDLGQNTKV